MALSLTVQFDIHETDYREVDPRIMFDRTDYDDEGNKVEMSDEEYEKFICEFIGKARFTVRALANGKCLTVQSPLYDPATVERAEAFEGTLRWLSKSIMSNEKKLAAAPLPACDSPV